MCRCHEFLIDARNYQFPKEVIWDPSFMKCAPHKAVDVKPGRVAFRAKDIDGIVVGDFSQLRGQLP